MNLAVTAPDLRVGQGYVRCGRCERVFNALLSLSDELDPVQEPSSRATGTISVPAMDTEPELEHEEELRDPEEDPEEEHEELEEEEEDEPAGAAADAPTPAPAARTPAPRGAAPEPAMDVFESQAAATGSYETIVLEGETFLQTEEHIDVAEIDQQIQQIARQIGNGSAPLNPVLTTDPAPPRQQEVDPLFGRPRVHWGWGVAVALLLLLLAGQLVHHNRQTLVADPRLERPMQAVYGMFGITLEPSWDLAAYDLRQLGAEAMGDSTTILLRASVQNLAPHPQPPPLIRALLQDRYGNTISTVAVLPQDYARGQSPSRLAPQQRLDAQLQLADPQRQAVSFQLDVCLPGKDAELHCSGQP